MHNKTDGHIQRREPAMSVARVTEIKAASTKSFDDAVQMGVARAAQTLKNVKAAWVQNQEVLVDEKGKITEYRVQLKVTFILED
jgi:flavin-binding protein dodecin